MFIEKSPDLVQFEEFVAQEIKRALEAVVPFYGDCTEASGDVDRLCNLGRNMCIDELKRNIDDYLKKL